ncbi:MAG: ion transporter [Myxococcales bacterium]|nr:ion transporter [Myxococcales bacterium]
MRASLMSRLIDERLVLTVITLNMLALFLRGFPSLDAGERGLLWLVDYACTCYFAVEIALKIALRGWRTFWSVTLNRFDFVIVLAGLPTLATAFFDFDGDLSMLLLLRAVRLIRLFRILRFIPSADQLWSGIGRALRASVGLILMLLIYDVVVGLVACHLFRDAAPAEFADPITSAYTVFKVFTVEGWYEIPDAIAAADPNGLSGTLARGFFVLVVLTGGLLGLSIANAALVDEMVLDNNDALEREVAALRSEIGRMHDEQRALLARVAAHLDDREASRVPRP